MSVQVKAADVTASEVENSAKAASTDPARTFASNFARNSGRVPAQSLTFGAELGGAKPSRLTVKDCNGRVKQCKMNALTQTNEKGENHTILPACATKTFREASPFWNT